MKRSLIVLAVVAAAALSITALPQRAKEAETLFHRGVHFEEVRGELKAAIAIYEEIVKKYPENRPLAAKAYYHLGVCYEKMGRTQAADAFKTIVEKYPDQTEIALLAKEKLGLLARAEASGERAEEGLKISLVWQGPDMDNTGTISPDGKSLSCVDWTTSDLAVRDMATGQVRRLTSKEGAPPGSYEVPDHSIWAPDSRQIAYNCYGNNPTFCELRLIRLDGSKPRVLYQGDYFKDWAYPSDWSPDGRSILTCFFRGTDYSRPSFEVGLVSVEDGSVQYLEALRGVEMSLAKFSPDGRHILYDHPQTAGSESHDISLLALETKNTIPVIEHPADDKLLGWTPDGRGVVFSSNRTGTWDAWMIPIAEGKPQGASRMIKKELGQVVSMGLTEAGSLYYSTPGFQWDIFSASIDAESGRLLEGPQKLPLPYEGHNYLPSLSPDGKSVAYVSQRGSYERNWRLGVYSLESGEVQEVRLKGDFRGGFGIRDWMPDGRTILLRGNEIGQGAGLFKVDLQTGEAALLLRDSLPKNEQNLPERDNYRISRDGQTLYYLDQGPERSCRVMAYRLGSKDEKEICELPSYSPNDNNTLCLSPDGLWLALLLRDEESARALKVVPAAGGEVREIHRFDQGGRWIIDIAWSPDGRYIYYSKQVEPKKTVGLWGLWRVPVSGGSAQDLRITANIIGRLNFHPDGNRIIFHSRTSKEQAGAIWAMENFLPKK